MAANVENRGDNSEKLIKMVLSLTEAVIRDIKLMYY